MPRARECGVHLSDPESRVGVATTWFPSPRRAAGIPALSVSSHPRGEGPSRSSKPRSARVGQMGTGARGALARLPGPRAVAHSFRFTGRDSEDARGSLSGEPCAGAGSPTAHCTDCPQKARPQLPRTVCVCGPAWRRQKVSGRLRNDTCKACVGDTRLQRQNTQRGEVAVRGEGPRTRTQEGGARLWVGELVTQTQSGVITEEGPHSPSPGRGSELPM